MRTREAGVALSVAACATGAAWGAIDLEFRPVSAVYAVGDQVEIGLYAVSDSAASQSLSATEVIFTWDAGVLAFTGLDGTGGAGLALADFMTVGSGGLNETNPPTDGDGLFFGFANFGTPVNATPGGTLLTTFLFDALAESPATAIDILASAGAPIRATVVYDGVQPNTDVTGALSGASVRIVPAPACSLLVVFGAAMRRRR